MNSELVATLEEMQKVASILGEVYKEKAYRRAAREVKKVPYKITPTRLPDLAENKIPGVGAGILQTIKEFATSGRVADLERARKNKAVKAYYTLSKIAGVGPATINKWIKNGIYDLVALRRAVGKGKIELNHMQKLGLLYYNDLNERIPRAEIDAISAAIRQCAAAINPQALFEVAGSYRRGAATSGDIDILIAERNPSGDFMRRMIDSISQSPAYVDTMSRGEQRVTFLYKHYTCVRQIDILYLPYESYYAGILYFTGSWNFNECMRGLAKRGGFRLNQIGLYRSGVIVPVNSEREIFDAIAMPYVPPEKRV